MNGQWNSGARWANRMGRRRWWLALALSLAGLCGCVGRPTDSVTLEVELPAQFELKTAANYRPAPGETCTLPRRSGKRAERKVFFADYTAEASRVSYRLPLRETVEGCPLVLADVAFDLNAQWGSRSTDVGGDFAGISIRDRLPADAPGMPQSGVLELFGQCQWLFRTAGPQHAILKILKCAALETPGQAGNARAGGAVRRDELGGKTIRVNISLTDEERPFMGDNWVRFPKGWKRCLGTSFEDRYAFCRGNTTDFKPFKMPDGRLCDIYPTCTE